MTQLAWVVGASGLLGSALVRALDACKVTLHRPAAPFEWRNVVRVREQISNEIAKFGILAQQADSWSIFWAAGNGSMSSDDAALDTEASTLLGLLDGVAECAPLRDCPGTIVFASSAGALYSGMSAACYNETSAVSPATPYAQHKLRQETMVQEFAAAASNAGALILRYSTLYGVGQARDKTQGLITQIARRIVANEPAHIYVPLDTIRDYQHVDDAALRTVSTWRDVQNVRGAAVIKIIAAERATSIAQLIGIFRRVAGRTPRLVTSTNALSAKYMRCVQFKSAENAGKPHSPDRTLVEGIHQILEEERAKRIRSR